MKQMLVLFLISLGMSAAAADSPDRRNVEIVFDRNKGGIYAIYARELKDNPRFAGKLVLAIDIAKSGAVTQCRVQRSTFNAPGFESRICDRVRLMKFAPGAAPITITKPLEFFPAA
jgi:hypothetical protein